MSRTTGERKNNMLKCLNQDSLQEVTEQEDSLQEVTEYIKGSGSVDLTVVEISRLGWQMSGAEVGSVTNKNHLPLLQVQILMVELEHWENIYSQIALYFFNNEQ